MSRCFALVGLLVGLSSLGCAAAGARRRGRRRRRQHGRAAPAAAAGPAASGIVMNPPSSYSQNTAPARRSPTRRGTRCPTAPSRPTTPTPSRPPTRTGRRSSSTAQDHPPRERQRHRLGGDRLRDADRRLHERPADVRHALELREGALQRKPPDDLVPGGPVSQQLHTSSRLGDRRRRGHGLRAPHGQQAVERRQLRVRRDDADREHLHARGERQHPPGGRQLRIERPEPARSRPTSRRRTTACSPASTRATTGWASSTSATRSWPAASGSYGLVPNWVNQSGAGVTVSNSAVDPYFGYDACRIPFRIGMDYCLNGDARRADLRRAHLGVLRARSRRPPR